MYVYCVQVRPTFVYKVCTILVPSGPSDVVRLESYLHIHIWLHCG